MSDIHIFEEKIYINIDSKDIKKNKNYTFNKLGNLPNNPLSINYTSEILNIYYPNHNLTNDILVLLENIQGRIFNYKIDINNFIDKSNVFKINLDAFNLDELSINIHKYEKQYIYINKINYENKYINNVNINILKDYYELYYDSKNKYYYIKLPIIFHNDNNNNNNSCIITINFMNIFGINTNKINNIPIKINEIIDDNNFNIVLTSKASIDITNKKGGNNIIIKIINNTDINNNNNNYNIKLENIIKNIKNIKIITSIIPHSEYNIKDKYFYITILNHDEFKIKIPDGYYNITNLMDTLKYKFSLLSIKYNNDIIDKNNYNIFHSFILNPIFNTYNDIVSFKLSQKVNIINGLSISKNDSKIFFYINHINHNLQKDDIITIENSVDIHGIDKKYINKSHIITNIIDKDNYYIKVEHLLDDYSISADLIDTDIILTFPIYFSLNFSYTDTIGENLGFLNVGEKYSSTYFKKEISNTSPYVFEEENFIKKNNKIILNEHNYIFLNFNILSTNFKIAKIYLNKLNNYVYDNHINIINKLPHIIPHISELDVSFTKYNGELYDFGNREHSFLVEFTCDKIINENTYINPNTNLSNMEYDIKQIYVLK